MTPLRWCDRAVAVLLLVSVIVSYNRFVRQRTLVDESWGGIDVELSRRHDLIPNLVETVRGTPRTSGRCSSCWSGPARPPPRTATTRRTRARASRTP